MSREEKTVGNAREVLMKITSSLAEGNVTIASKLVSEVLHSADEYTRGFSDCLSGILKDLQNGAGMFFSGKIIKSNSSIEKEIRSLRNTMESHLLSEWDRGYFDAWISYLKALRNATKRPSVKEYTVDENPKKQPGQEEAPDSYGE
jgi:hypothetical protein